MHLSWASTLAERQPALVPLLQNIQLSADDVNQWSLAIVNGGEPEQILKDWVAANPTLIAQWMAQ